MAPVHPLKDLSADEVTQTRDILRSANTGKSILFRQLGLQEPPKAELLEFLEAEHAGQPLDSLPRPPRVAKCCYDVLPGGKEPIQYRDATIDLTNGKVLTDTLIDVDMHPALTPGEFQAVIDIIRASPEFKDAIAKLKIPDYMEIVIEPWPYGYAETAEDTGRLFQGLIFGRDKRQKDDPDSNFYAFPIPIIPVLDIAERRVTRILEMPTGGKGEELRPATDMLKNDSATNAARENPIAGLKPAEYIPDLLPNGTRKSLKTLNVVQPDGPSFTVTDDSLVEWQNWRFRVGFTPREGAIIHDVRFDGRSLFHRLSVSEMTVPYADPRDPFHRKQAFDFGEGGAGGFANNLSLGCDCLGVIKYFDGVTIDPQGNVQRQPNVVCLHEQDNGIGWKHTNWITERAVVTRNRELVVQFILTLNNYEYLFAFKFNLAGGIDIEVRATGVVSVVNIDPGKTSEYGNVVSNGILAQNHQHIFAARIDPAIDGQKNTVIQEESVPEPMNATTNPNGNWYRIKQEAITRSSWADASPFTNRIFKITNPSKKNPVSGKPVAYKVVPPPTQLLLADPRSPQAQRAAFAQHHIWVTKYRDDDLWAAGLYPFQSRKEVGGVQDMVARGDNVENEDIVVWAVFGLTHNPRVEDWPVMPAEIHQVLLRPSDFFHENPAIDVPGAKNCASKQV